MATNKITYTLDFKANFKDVEGQLNTLKQSLNSVIGMKMNPTKGMSAEIKAAADAAMSLKGHMAKALDPSTGKLDLSRLQVQLKASGQSAGTLMNNLLQGGKQGAEAFLQVGNAIVNAQKPMHRFSTLSKELWVTLKNTAKWQISSYALTSMTSAFSNALTFAKELDKSLNDIRIVTGDSREQMEKFAVAANKTAKALSTTTKHVADATLIYRQQGDTAEEAAKKAEITIKAANAARAEAQEMSEYLTGIWNSYQVGAESLELFADKLVKVGVVTATTAEELATSMTKVAATANTVGVSYDQLLSTIATVSSATRISAEQIGTAFKTIYARMGDLELKGSIDEDGVTTTLGTVSSSLKQVGVNVLDANGNIRDMGVVIEDLGGKWETMALNQKTAIAEAVAGKRQYTQLFALFENWDEYQRTLKEAGDAQGELNKQQAIFSDSIKGAQARLKAAKEEFLLEGVSGETIQDLIDGLAYVIKGFNGATKAAGGLQPILMTLGGYLLTKFAPQISTKMVDMWGGFLSSVGLAESNVLRLQKEVEETFAKAKSNPHIANDAVAKSQLELMETQNKLQIEMTEKLKHYNAEQRESYNIQKKILEQTYEISSAEKMGAVTTAKQGIETARRDIIRTGGVANVNESAVTALKNANISDNLKTSLDNLNHDFTTGSLKIEEFIQKIAKIDDVTGELNLIQDDFTALSNALARNSMDAENVENALRDLIIAETEYQNAVKDATRNTEEHRQKLEALPGQIEAEKQARKDNIKTLEEEKQKLKELNQEKEATKTKIFNLSQEKSNVRDGLGEIQDKLSSASMKKNGKGKKKFVGLGISDKDKVKQVKETVSAVNKGDLNTEQIQEAIDNLGENAKGKAKEIREALMSALDIAKAEEKFKQDINDAKKSLDDLGRKSKETENKIKNFKKNGFDNPSIKSSMKDYLAIGGSMVQLGMSFSMMTSSFSTLSDEEVSVSQKLMASMSLLMAVISSLNGITELNTILKEKNILITIASAIANQSEAAANSTSMTSKIGHTIATWGLVAAETALKAVTGDMTALMKLGTVAIMGITAALISYIKTESKAEKETQEFNKAQKELEKLDENKTAIEEEITSLQSLSEKLIDTSNSTLNLVDIENELNKVLGTNIDLLNGGSTELNRANSLIKARIKLKEEELEINRKQAAEQYQIQNRTVTAKTANKWWSTSDTMSNEQLQSIVKEINFHWSEKRRDDFFAGKLGAETVYIDGLGFEEIDFESIAEATQKIKETTTNFANSFLENVSSPLNTATKDLTIKFAELGASGKETQLFLESYADIADEISKAYSKSDEDALLKALNKMQIPENMDDKFYEYSKKAIAELRELNKIEEKRKTESSEGKIISDNSITFRKSQEAIQSLLSKYSEQQGLTFNDIDDFLSKSEEILGITAEQKEKLEDELINAKSSNEIAKILGQISFSKILNNEEIKEQLRQGNSEQLERLLSETGVINSKEIAKNWMETERYIAKISKNAENLAKDHEFWSSKGNFTLSDDVLKEITQNMQKLQEEFGYTEQSAQALVLQETIFNNQQLTVDQKIGALQNYAQSIGMVNTAFGSVISSMGSLDISNMSKEDLESYGYKKKNNKIYLGDTEVSENDVRLSILQEANTTQVQREFYTNMSNLSKREKKDLEKKHNRDIEKWLKEDSLAKVEDRIQEFTLKITQKQREIESIDWKLELFGESKEVGNYLQKAQLMTEKASLLVDEFHKLSEMEPVSVDEASAIVSRMNEVYSEWMSIQKEIIEQENELIEKTATDLTEILETEYELIIATVEAMSTLLTLNMKRKGMFSEEKEKNALLKLFGQNLSAMTEEQKEQNKKVQNRKKLNKELINLDKNMQEEINKLELKALQDGIKEREKERKRELEDLEDAFDKSMEIVEARISTAAKKINDELNIVLAKIARIMNNSYEDVSNIYNSKGELSGFHKKSENVRSFTLEDFAEGAVSYKVVGYDKKNQRMVIAGVDETGKEIDYMKYDIDKNDKEGSLINFEEGDTIGVGTILGQTKNLWQYRQGSAGTNTKREKSIALSAKNVAYANQEHKDTKMTGDFTTTNGKVVFSVKGDEYFIPEGMAHKIYENNKVTGIRLEQGPVISNTHGFSKKLLDYWYRYYIKEEKLTKDEIKDWEDMAAKYNKGELFLGDYIDGHAKGSDSTPAGEAFVGEEGRELILLPDGKIVLAGQDGMELANLPQGARVLTNEETEEILRNKKDYANLILSETSKSGQRIAFNRFAEGTNSLQNKDFISNTTNLQEEFYKSELNRQQEQNSAIKTSLENKNKQVEKETDKHYKSLESKTKEMSSSIQKIMGETNIKLPEIESEDFIDSLEKTITKAYLMIYGGEEWLTPVQGAITSKFGKRNTGIKGASTNHKGIDIGAASGMPILATRDGKVVASTSNKESGYYIRIDHGDGYVSAYAHMKELSNLKPGDKVSQGDVIGYVGSTGISSGAHLHFAVYKDGKAIDPEKLIAHARGGVTKQGKALVGEYGREIILYPDGTAGLLGEDGMEFADLPAGAQIIPNEETEKILNNPVDYKLPSFANGTSFNWNNEIQKEMEEWLSGLSQMNRASQASSILKFYNDYENKTKEEITAFTDQLAFDAMGEAGRIHKEGIAFITQLWEDYQKSGEKNVAFELWIASQAETLSEKYDEAIEQWEERVEQQRQAYQADLEFNKRTRTIQGSWNSKKELDNAYKQLIYDLEHSPEDMEKIFENWENYINASETYMNDYLTEFNRQYSELIRLEEERITRLEQLKTLQEGINQETNSYREVMHDINKELNSSKISTQWLDEKTKQYLFNEQDYLAVSEKVAEVRSAALQDWEDTQEAINNLSNDELYKAQYLNEAYQERADIRAKELGVLREELNLQKKQTALNEALMERNVRVFSGGRWRQIANVENVRKAQEDLDETRYQIETKQIELDQQKDINTTYNEPLRESNQQIAGWNKIMELAAKALEDDFRELKGTVEVTDLSLESFREELGYIVEDIKADRAILAKRYGLENGVTKEEFESKLKPNELAENVVLIAKRMYDEGNTEGAKAFVDEYRSMMPKWLQKETAENITADAVEQGIKSRYGRTLTVDEVLNNMKNEEHKDIISSYYNQDLATYEMAIYRNKAEYERLVNEGVSYDDPRLKLISETITKLREDYLSMGGSEKRLGSTESAKDYYKMIEEKYGTNFVSELAQETATDFTNRMIDIIDNYQSLAIEAVEFLESVQTDFSKLSSENLETVFKTIDTWQAKILIRLKELESKESNGTIVVEQANATGTRDAQSGFSLVNEKGVEMLSTDYGQIIELNPHQKIFNNDQMNFLYDLSREGLKGMDRTVSAISNSMQDNSLSIAHLEVKLDNVTDAKSFAEELQGLTSYIRNTKTIQGRSSR